MEGCSSWLPSVLGLVVSPLQVHTAPWGVQCHKTGLHPSLQQELDLILTRLVAMLVLVHLRHDSSVEVRSLCFAAELMNYGLLVEGQHLIPHCEY